MPTSTTESNSLRDHFLLAMPALRGGFFSHSITYICEHNAEGAMGIVINQPLDISVADIFKHLKIKSQDNAFGIPVMAGGPVQTDHGFVLHKHCDTSWEGSMQVTEEVTLTSSKDILQSIAGGTGPHEHLIALGYAGWSAGQLEEELINNAWLTLPADNSILFSTPYQHRHTAAAALLGVDMNLISGQVGHA